MMSTALDLSAKSRTVSVQPLVSAFLLLCLSLGFSFSACKESSPQSIIVAPPETFFSSALELGTPQDADASDDILLRHFEYTVSYNPNLNVANWVAWNEDSAWYGPAERCDCFENDPTLPSYLAPVTNSCYTGSGYDRGHICNSEARTRNDSINRATFYYSNIFPQTPSLNRQTWYSLERYCDSLSKRANKELYIIAGGIYNTKKRLQDLVTIPDSCWKIVVILDRSQRRTAVTNSTQVIAVMMNNGVYTTDKNEWQLYKTTVRAIEQSSGYSFLNALPTEVQDAIETTKY